MRIEIDVQTGEVKYIEDEPAAVPPAPAPEPLPDTIDGSAA